MKRLIFFIMLIVGFCFTTKANSVDVLVTSQKKPVIKQVPAIGDHQSKFQSGMIDLTVWRDHQKIADIVCKPQRPFRPSQ